MEMTLIMPIGAASLSPEEMEGVEKIVIVKAEGQWLVRVFPDSGKMIASGGGLGSTIAGALYQALIVHNHTQGH